MIARRKKAYSFSFFYKEKIRIVMRILIEIFLLSAEMTAQRITYAIGIISTNSALFFNQSPSVSK